MSSGFASLLPQCIYIHIPFCLKKCGYCDFYSLAGASADVLERYTQALLTEIDQQATKMPDTIIRSIYFGGGTPSLLAGQQIESILARVRSRFRVDPGAEITLEANPATLDREKLSSIMGSGVNRLSLGVQSFSDDELRMLGRVHSSNDVFRTIELVQSLGLKNYNMDLIYGLPGQSIRGWLYNLEQAVSCRPAHISMYLLQLDPCTPMGRETAAGRLILPDDELEAQMYYSGIDYLNGKGYQQYEISNLSLSGAECRHNIFYWQSAPYLGLGAGAVSFGGGRRWRNQADVKAYLENLSVNRAVPVEELESMDDNGLVSDALILGLRMTEGIDLEYFAVRFGVDLTRQYESVIELCRARGLLEVEHGRLFLTRAGYFLSNEVLCRFMA
ncbi:MAG: radical SAM family heme chaperone HemW [Syntrophomonadaceae bacterium]|nr:radical SAM family heme chaperone HemW [Syntrophomonadaceae bacterium]